MNEALPDFWVYKAYGEDGELLYVGCTGAGLGRLRTHCCDVKSKWGPFVQRIDIEHWPDRDSALKREIELIQERDPSRNIRDRVASQRNSPSVRFEMRMPTDLFAQIEEARGEMSRSQFVVRAIEAALGDDAGGKILPEPEKS